MHFQPAPIPGVVVVRPERFEDERGYFARAWAKDAFEEQGLNTSIVQCSSSYNTKKGTLRGMHYQPAPHAEAKFVRCTRGAIYDVTVDIRPDSPTFKQWFGIELTAENGVALYIPEGCAHGFLTLEDATDVFYMITAPYTPEASRGFRYNDPAFGIDWPGEAIVINERDASYSDFNG